MLKSGRERPEGSVDVNQTCAAEIFFIVVIDVFCCRQEGSGDGRERWERSADVHLVVIYIIQTPGVTRVGGGGGALVTIDAWPQVESCRAMEVVDRGLHQLD